MRFRTIAAPIAACVVLSASFLMWAVTNDGVSACSSDIGVIAQSLDTHDSNYCAAASFIHSLGLGGLVLSIISLVVWAIYRLTHSNQAR